MDEQESIDTFRLELMVGLTQAGGYTYISEIKADPTLIDGIHKDVFSFWFYISNRDDGMFNLDDFERSCDQLLYEGLEKLNNRENYEFKSKTEFERMIITVRDDVVVFDNDEGDIIYGAYADVIDSLNLLKAQYQLLNQSDWDVKALL